MLSSCSVRTRHGILVREHFTVDLYCGRGVCDLSISQGDYIAANISEYRCTYLMMKVFPENPLDKKLILPTFRPDALVSFSGQ